MSQPISLKQAERRVFKTALNDGLLDVLIGSFVLMFAIGPLLSRSLGDLGSTVIFVPFWALIYIAILLVRKYVVGPRMGLVIFGPARKKMLTKYSTMMLAVNLAALIAGTFFALKTNVAAGWIYMAILGLSVLLISSTAAYYLNSPRLFIYGLLFLLSLIAGEILYTNFAFSHHGFPITFGITAAIIITTGLVIFFRLLRGNPLPVNESSSEKQAG
jgi:hypothetical protein